MVLELEETEIVWPGNTRSKPQGKFLPTHLKVLTIEEKPFVYVRKIDPEAGEECSMEKSEVPCPLFNVSRKGDSHDILLNLLLSFKGLIGAGKKTKQNQINSINMWLGNLNVSCRRWTRSLLQRLLHGSLE